jgi:hypothetical protein
MENWAMSEVLSLKEIKAKFDFEWILLENPETTDSLEVRSGKVLWHSKDRDEVYRIARKVKPRNCAILYLGPVVPEGTATAL